MRSGEFARLCGTTKNTLIHYDELGILKPSQRGSNGYRSYTMDDYMTFTVVHAFAQAGFPLKKIGRLVRDHDAAALARAAEENRAAIAEQRAALERSERLLEEMDRQARAALTFEPGEVRLAQRERRLLLVVREGCGLHVGDDLTDLYREDARALELLKGIAPEAEVAPYGLAGALDGEGQLLYDTLFYELPPGVRPCGAKNVVALPSGTYAEADYEGPWEDVMEAYEGLMRFVGTQELRAADTFYEVAQMRLLDTDPALYHCRISVPVTQEDACVRG